MKDIKEIIDKELNKREKPIRKGLLVVGLNEGEANSFKYLAKKLYIFYYKKFEVILLKAARSFIKFYDFHTNIEDYKIIRGEKDLTSLKDKAKEIIQFTISGSDNDNTSNENENIFSTKELYYNGKKDKQLAFILK